MVAVASAADAVVSLTKIIRAFVDKNGWFMGRVMSSGSPSSWVNSIKVFWVTKSAPNATASCKLPPLLS